VIAQLRLTVPLNDPAGVTARSKDAVCPAVIVAEFEDPEAGPIAKSGNAVPVPDKSTACGLPSALSVIPRLAVALAATVGVKTTLMVQLDPGSTMVQLLVWLNWLASAPVTATDDTVRTALLLVLFNVTLAGELLVPTACAGKARAEGVTVTVGAVAVPDKATVCGLPTTLSLIARLAVALPPAVGVKTTLIVQAAPG
jgi:hypothetical protein